MNPQVLLLGQLTIDDTVPAEPGPWQRKLGGNALYSLAGAKLWCDPDALGVVARVPADLPFDIFAILENAGVSTRGLTVVQQNALVEWITYEEDGNRQSFPRNPELRDPSADLVTLQRRYLTHIETISASHHDIPSDWLPAEAIHLAPQVAERHSPSCVALSSQTKHLSVDPSPHYSRGRSAIDICALLRGATAFLPSQAEIEHLGIGLTDWLEPVRALRSAGFSEVLLKRGALGSLLSFGDTTEIQVLPAATALPRDLTGAGDAFSGAYAASRSMGKTPEEATARATVAAAMIIECFGAEEALQLKPQDARARLNTHLNGQNVR